MTERSQECMVCGSAMSLRYAKMFDDRYGYPGLFDIFQCSRCGQLRTVPPLRESELSGVYSRYYPRNRIDLKALSSQAMDLTSRKTRLLCWLKGITNQGQFHARSGMIVLDYGCGAGVSLLELNKLGARCYGIEADTNVRAVADHYGLDIHIGSLAGDPFPEIRYDLIVLNQVIEHIPDPAHLLEQLFARLKQGGMIAVSFPNAGSIYRRLFGRTWINWHTPYHLHHFNKRSFELYCRRRKWEIIKAKTVTPNMWTILQLRALVSRTSVGISNPMWGTKTGVDAVSDVPEGGDGKHSPPVSVIRKTRHIIKKSILLCANIMLVVVNRSIDALGMGDSLIVLVRQGK